MHKTQSVDQRAERPVDPKFSSINLQAERINEATNRLDSLVSSLYNNLSPVLKDEKPMQVMAEKRPTKSRVELCISDVRKCRRTGSAVSPSVFLDRSPGYLTTEALCLL